ncbi:hypothetical protein VNO78_00482 [Psophocarpus tetragonolobus]|uniref:Uncharacterized protein n=1 Tax=Psophocarpus tetragonolobus TaxID=3891 RepID=A0AAN9SX57_PSOTE
MSQIISMYTRSNRNIKSIDSFDTRRTAGLPFMNQRSKQDLYGNSLVFAYWHSHLCCICWTITKTIKLKLVGQWITGGTG